MHCVATVVLRKQLNFKSAVIRSNRSSCLCSFTQLEIKFKINKKNMAARNNLNGLIRLGSHPYWFKAIIYLGQIRRENKKKTCKSTQSTHTQRLIIHTDLVKNSWMIPCTTENSCTIGSQFSRSSGEHKDILRRKAYCSTEKLTRKSPKGKWVSNVIKNWFCLPLVLSVIC